MCAREYPMHVYSEEQSAKVSPELQPSPNCVGLLDTSIEVVWPELTTLSFIYHIPASSSIELDPMYLGLICRESA